MGLAAAGYNYSDIFVHDLLTGVTARLSVDSVGMESNSYSYDASISVDGLYVTFVSMGSNLVSDDKNKVPDVFIVPATVYNLTVSKSGAGKGTVYNNRSTPAGISCGFVCSYYFVSGTTINLEAVPDSGYIFSGWDGDVTGTENPTIFTINKNMFVNSNFGEFWKAYLPFLVR